MCCEGGMGEASTNPKSEGREVCVDRKLPHEQAWG